MRCWGVGVEGFKSNDLTEGRVVLLDDAIRLGVEVSADRVCAQLLKKIRINFAEGDALVDHSLRIKGQFVEFDVPIRLGMRQQCVGAQMPRFQNEVVAGDPALDARDAFTPIQGDRRARDRCHQRL